MNRGILIRIRRAVRERRYQWWTEGAAMNERNYPCEFCDTDQPQRKKLVTVARQRHGQWFIFENVPAWVCPHCGHRYFDADVLAAMEDRMKAMPDDARPVKAWAISLPQTTG